MTTQSLGGQTATSPVIQAELAEFFAYRAELLALSQYPYPERAARYREILARRIPSVVPIFKELGL